MNELCGCGLPAKYYRISTITEEASCNKYYTCPTYKELTETNRQTQARLNMYQVAVNKIDDYFEYQGESKKDQKKVHQLLGNLCDALVSYK